MTIEAPEPQDFPAEPITELPKRKSFLRRRGMLLATLLSLTLGITAIAMAAGPFFHYLNSDPTEDGYVPPYAIYKVVNKTFESTFPIYCDVTKKDGTQGSGWVIDKADLFPLQDPVIEAAANKFKTLLITNHHVIDECIKIGKLTTWMDGKEYPAELLISDKKVDLAVLGISVKQPPLGLTHYFPGNGYWILVAGYPLGLPQAVSFGNVITFDEETNKVFMSAAIASGSSGGPVVDNEGNVIGTTTSSLTKDYVNVAVGLNAFCNKITDCSKTPFWSED